MSTLIVKNGTDRRVLSDGHPSRPHLPIILCTGYSSGMDSRRAEEVGIGTMLMKPFTLVNLAAHVRRLLD